MRRQGALGILALVVSGAAAVAAQEKAADPSKPKVPIVSVIGCATRTADGGWMLTNATEGVESKVLFSSAKEVEDAKKKPLGNIRYKLMGTPEFLTKEELMKSGQRAEFTRPDVANATGQLRDGRKLFVKGLLITADNERRLNLTSVQSLADTCKR